MIFTHLLLDEPDLEFGDGGKHPDPRMGLVRYGPLQPVVGDRISLGVIGTAETVEGFERWMERLKAAIPGKSDKQPNLFPPMKSVPLPLRSQPHRQTRSADTGCSRHCIHQRS